MKIVGITILFMVVLIPATISINLFFYGLDIKGAINDWTRPLYMRTMSENLFYIIYPLIILCRPIVLYFLDKKRNS
ncbi:hypothetical protein ABB05_05385 [Lederbergia galactosidilytica]|uniref:Uncharacterized protein n=1 Tax=Lederbergia galactosidilytica TaxID=217031 RepID=A0A0Q9XVI4_9BACI|nr:hypothetical protein ACA29_10550 [Lederbergia galactosidilytica]OAK73867.1 hypothetical protein ABB05_05385 [Lederbergia galactosidilytica]